MFEEVGPPLFLESQYADQSHSKVAVWFFQLFGALWTLSLIL